MNKETIIIIAVAVTATVALGAGIRYFFKKKDTKELPSGPEAPAAEA